MNPLIKMEAVKDSFSDVEQKIFIKIKSDPYYVVQSGIVGLADWCKVSQPSITRFCKKIGYTKFSDFKQEMYLYVLGEGNQEGEKTNKDDAVNNFIQLVTLIEEKLTKDSLDDFASSLFEYDNIFFTGIVESGVVGRLLTYKLRRLGLKCFFIEPTELNDTIFFSSKNELIVIFSARGPVVGNDLGEFMKRSDKFNGDIFLVTMNPEYKNSSISKKITLPRPHTFNTSPNFVFQYFAERLISSIAKLLNTD
ncbi:MurR/RpiR family transcriptional regulator [Enterococcus raffinosus]|uniref:MurR/RpiR family transcriptional regulator n=1 Tax=Enterococcus raffinosus TaxID=71452 RepID=UPI001C1281F2|nr:MurR/RpiR family transcriptional regulator [Enterococcus raffinosus]MBU5362189.1 MurR/RpiR family transcriptional regulator [Enterococcus raffinosus]